MLRGPIDEAERDSARTRLDEARDLMVRALAIIDGTPVAIDCDAHLDQAVHNLSNAIADVSAGACVFIDRIAEDQLIPADFNENGLIESSPKNPWQ